MDIKMVIQKKNGSAFDITSITENVTTSGDIKQCGRKLEFSTIRSSGFNVASGDIVKFYHDGLEVFRGTILAVSKNSSSNTFKYTAFDEGWRLTKSKGSFNFKDKTADQIASEVLQKNNFAKGEIAKGKTKISKVFVNKPFYDIIMTAYTGESKSNNKKYMFAITRQKVNIIEKGVTVLEVGFEEGRNIIDSEYSISAENIVDRIVLTDANGNQKEIKDKKDLIELYGVIQEVRELKESGLSADEINNIFKDIEKKCSLKGLSDGTCVTGNAVMVRDTISGLVGKFYIDSDTHSYSNNYHEVSLVLNFDNIMDEKVEQNTEQATDETGAPLESGATGGGNNRAVSLAKSQLGKQYKWGATGPSRFDCSGLIYWVAKQMGKSIPRTSSEQSKFGQAVSKGALQPGDLVFFGKGRVHHVGMYVGDGKYLHAPQTGDVVKISKLSSRSDYHNARRFL